MLDPFAPEEFKDELKYGATQPLIPDQSEVNRQEPGLKESIQGNHCTGRIIRIK
jgi:hypothetical protein